MLNNVITRKVKSMKVLDYFEYRKCEYVYLQLIVTKSNRNNNTEQIASLVNKMFKKTNKYICQSSKKLIIEERPKLSFYIHITKEKVNFYFIIPKIFQNSFKTKFKEVWKNIEIKEVDSLPVDFNSCSKFDLHYKYDDSLSLAVDLRNNDLLNSNMNITSMLEENEEVGIFYNFIPTSEKESNYFRSRTYEDAIKKYKNCENLKKTKSAKDYSIKLLKNLVDFINGLLNSILGANNNSSSVINPIKKEISNSTKRKGDKAICKNQTIIITKSDKKEREIELSKTLANTFEKIKDNNELIVTKINKDIDIKKTIIKNVKINKTTVEECSNFINMPSTEVIKQFNMIEHNKTVESPVPKELTKGIISLGENKCKETYEEAFLSDDINLQSLPLAILGASRSGKSTYSINMCKNIIDAGEGLIAIDFIKNTELADDIKSITPEHRLIDIDLSNPLMVQSLAYNEIKITKDMTPYQISKISRRQTNNIMKLINIINKDEKQLAPKMRKLLGAGARIAFCYSNSSMREVLDILQYHETRKKYIDGLSDDLKELLRDSIKSLSEIDELNKKGEVIGTKDTKIEGIIDRIDLMRENTIVDEMLSKSPQNNIDFVEAMEAGKVILIRMRDIDFEDEESIDILTSFFLQKIWASLKIRGTMHKLPSRVTVLIDEVFQTPSAQKILAKNFVQSAKFGLKYVLTLHYLDQLSNEAKKGLRNANSSYMLISGVDEQAFSSFKNDFENEGYEIEDLLNLERYHSLNLIKTKNGKSAFITRLPSEIKN